MGSPSKSFFALMCCSAFNVVRIYAALVLLQYPVDENSRTQNYTCISDDEGAALLWSLDGNENLADKDFKPKRPASGNVRDCAVRDDSTCLAGWDETSDWELVNSLDNPTDLVLDNRFEDFPEFGSLLPNQLWRYQKVAETNASTGSLWFSVEMKRAKSFGIVLCEKEELHEGPCVVIRRNGTQIYSKVVRLGPDDYYGNISGTTYEAATRTNTSWFYNPNGDGWQTFYLKWNTEQRYVLLYQRSGDGKRVEIPKWDKISALGTYTEFNDHRIRFHFYDYYRTNSNNAVIYTKRFPHSGKMFCAEMLVNFCEYSCTIVITLLYEYTYKNTVRQREHDPWYIKSHSGMDGERVKDVVRVETEFDSDMTRYLRLKIKTISRGGKKWEIDNFRICKSVPREKLHIHPLGSSFVNRFGYVICRQEVRESTITLASGKDAICQQLSNTDTVKNSVSTSHEAEALLEMQKLLYYRNRPFVGRGGFICNPKGCICDQGFTGSKCEDECKDGFHGFLCTEKCGSCRNSQSCVKSTGFCEEGCLRGDMIKPFCKTALAAPTVENVGLTGAIVVLQGEVPQESKENIDIAIQIREVGGESWMNFTPELKNSGETYRWKLLLSESSTELKNARVSFRYEANVTGLKLNTTYRTRTVVTAETSNPVPILTFGSEINWTTCLDPETISLVVIPRNEESQIPINLVNPFSLHVTDELTNKVVFSAFRKSLPVNVTGHLSPSTEYGVKIVDTMNECTLIDTRLHISESDCEIDSHEYYDCKEKCGSCLDAGNCKQTTGSCPDECKGPKIAPFCHIALSIVKKPPADKTYLAWLAIIPVLAVCLLVLFIWYRKRKAALDEPPRERGREDPPLVPDRSTGFPASEVSIPLQQNGEHDQLTMSHTKNDTNMNKDSYENSS